MQSNQLVNIDRIGGPNAINPSQALVIKSIAERDGVQAVTFPDYIRASTTGNGVNRWESSAPGD